MNILRGLLLDNLGLKLVALLLALAVYLNVFTERPASMVVSFPLEFTDLPDSLTLSGLAPADVKAEIRGTGKQFIRLWLTEPRLKVSLAGVPAGHFDRVISADDLPLLPSDKIVVERLVGPGRLDLRIERAILRRIPVAPRVEGTPKAGWTWAGTILSDPATLLVRGPMHSIASLDSVRLKSVQVEGRRDTVRARVAPDSLPDWCSADPPTVMVAVPLRRP